MRPSLVRTGLFCMSCFLASCQDEPIAAPPNSTCNANAVHVGRAPLRRLTRVQYTNVVHGLFPDAQLPAFHLPDETIARGFENNADVQNPSAVLIEAYYHAARGAVAAAMVKPENVAPCLGGGGDATACGNELIRDFGRRAYRRPLTPAEMDRYAALFALGMAEPDGLRVGASLVLEAMLQSPAFLYVPEFGNTESSPNAPDVALTSHELAARLALFLWDDLPDEELSIAADANAFTDPAVLKWQALRMLDDPRARAMVRSFHRQWLDLGRLEKVSKDSATFPMWNAELRASMREETLAFVEDTVFDGAGTLPELLTGTTTRINGPLAELYGVAAPAKDWDNVTLDATERAGLLTLPGILAAHGHPVQPSPVLRGVFVLERLLCAPPPAPPPGVETNIDPAGSGNEPQTNRERYAAHVTNAACASCHASIDGAGFPFEPYDSIGRYRTTDNGFPVDSSGELRGFDNAGPVANAVELARRLAQSEDVRLCVTKQWFRYAFGHIEEAGDQCPIESFSQQFSSTGGDVRELIMELIMSHGFSYRPKGSGT